MKLLRNRHKKLFKKASVVIAGVVMCTTLASITPTMEVNAAATANSTLVWSDEFNGNSLDTSKWSYEIGNGSWGWGNNEQQYYTNRSENLSVHDGALHITAKRENYNGYNYTSARIKTEGKFYFKYGHVEARLALPSGQGIWPAFWTLGQDIGSVGWPLCGEIDIMEAINAENKVYGTTHWDSNGHANYGNSSGTFDITQYHIYTLDWDDQYIRMYVDGNKYNEIYIGGNAGSTDELHKSQFLLFNVAVGGNWPGFSIDNSKFPQTMRVDYVRVYQDNRNYVSTSGNSVDTNKGNSSSSTARYRLKNRHSGLYLDVNGGNTANGTNVQQWTANATEAQLWELNFNSEDSTYVLTNARSKKALDIEGWSNSNGGNALMWDNNNTNNQRWYITYVDGGYAFLINKNSNKCLEVNGWSTSAGGNVQQWDYYAQANQQWLIERVN